VTHLPERRRPLWERVRGKDPKGTDERTNIGGGGQKSLYNPSGGCVKLRRENGLDLGDYGIKRGASNV